ncbi:hypothetical protein [Mycobacteroides abscessus]|uniref:hypothetical protein n=1 Tax=Mycobacteroides abscessus TaxID=36809 RepID=UPI0009A75DA7|nr:hypothetical protein [Mycobacteroides abscessus]SKO02643.1 Uncharacterised protein [Mycobacteroides abscessus subsp. massiliense]
MSTALPPGDGADGLPGWRRFLRKLWAVLNPDPNGPWADVVFYDEDGGVHTRQRWLGREYLIDATGIDAEPYLLTVRDADGREYRSGHQSWQVAQKESWRLSNLHTRQVRDGREDSWPPDDESSAV